MLALKKAGIATLAIGFVLASCSKELKQNGNEQQPLNATDQLSSRNGLNPSQGIIFTLSNQASGNKVMSYLQQPNGKLSFVSATASGGNGTGAGLGSQGAIAIDHTNGWLFAVNAGSNSISSFSIAEDGSLQLAHTISSMGQLPISVTAHGKYVYVVNSNSSNISGYIRGEGGSLSPIPGSVQPLSGSNAGPAEIAFNPAGDKLIVTEKNTNKILSFAVSNSGVAMPAMQVASAGMTPFGFTFAGKETIVVTEASGGTPGASTVSSYGTTTSTTVLSGPIANHQTAACWAAATSDGRYAYVTNTGSNSISSFAINSDGTLRLINEAEVATGTTPTDITISSSQLYVYNLNAGSHSISVYKKGGNESLRKLEEVTGLPAGTVGLASY